MQPGVVFDSKMKLVISDPLEPDIIRGIMAFYYGVKMVGPAA